MCFVFVVSCWLFFVDLIVDVVVVFGNEVVVCYGLFVLLVVFDVFVG